MDSAQNSKGVLLISVQLTPTEQQPEMLVQAFQFVSDAERLKAFAGKTISNVQVTEATSNGMDPIILRLKISFTDGSFLEVDRKSTRLADQKRKLVHLDLIYQAK